MKSQQQGGFLVLDRKGEYIKDTIDQRGNRVFGLQNHPAAGRQMIVVSDRTEFQAQARQGLIAAHLRPRFNIRDVDPIDLADFLTGWTSAQDALIRDFAWVGDFYQKILAESQLGFIKKDDWFRDFPGLIEVKDSGRAELKKMEEEAAGEGREEMTAAELAKLQKHLGGTKTGVLERVILRIKRFCQSPLFGGSGRGQGILAAESCVDSVLEHLAAGRFVFVDMRGRDDDEYVLVAALFARKLLTVNKIRRDEDQIRACIVMEEAHNVLSEAELVKGDGRGSVFIELAREGRSFKLGFILVTQQPDAKSIAPQVAKTIDTVVAFNMPPEDARHLVRLKSQLADVELEIANAPEFVGVAASSVGLMSFRSCPVDDVFMKACAAGNLAEHLAALADPKSSTEDTEDEPPPATTIEDRLTALMAKRRESIRPVALATMKVWRNEDDEEEAVAF